MSSLNVKSGYINRLLKFLKNNFSEYEFIYCGNIDKFIKLYKRKFYDENINTYLICKGEWLENHNDWSLVIIRYGHSFGFPKSILTTNKDGLKRNIEGYLDLDKIDDIHTCDICFEKTRQTIICLNGCKEILCEKCFKENNINTCPFCRKKYVG